MRRNPLKPSTQAILLGGGVAALVITTIWLSRLGSNASSSAVVVPPPQPSFTPQVPVGGDVYNDPIFVVNYACYTEGGWKQNFDGWISESEWESKMSRLDLSPLLGDGCGLGSNHFAWKWKQGVGWRGQGFACPPGQGCGSWPR